MSGDIILEKEEHLAWVILNRPDKMNAINDPMIDQLSVIIDEIEADPQCRVMIFTGKGRAFSTGGDLGDFLDIAETGSKNCLARHLEKALAIFDRIEKSPVPSIAAINGVAVAGGLELILCCDIVIAAGSARLGDGHLRYGVIPGGGGSVRLPRKLPRNISNYLLLSGELLAAEELARYGLVNQVVPDEDLLQAARTLARTLASRSPLGIRLMKQMIRDGSEASQTEAILRERNIFDSYVDSPDFHEGLRAFAEKRAPRFGESSSCKCDSASG